MGKLDIAEVLYFEKSDSFKDDSKTKHSFESLYELVYQLVGKVIANLMTA